MQIDEKYFQPNGSQFNTIEDVLNEDEKILWRAKPNRAAHIWAAVLKMLPIALLWLVVDSVFIFFISQGFSRGEIPKGILAFIIPFFLIHLAPVWIWIANIVKSVAELKNIEYAITDRRIIIRSGVVGIDFKFFEYTQIDSVNVKVGLTDRIFKVGDIYINSSVNSGVLYDIENPYDLGRKLQKVTLDIKSDINYPNALRPDENPGYKTNYTDDPFK